MITVVSGLPRSGTSLMMQILMAAGMPILSDGERRPDLDNPRGYLEWERIKQLPKDPGCISKAEGKAVKVISQLLFSLPREHEYRVIFLRRPLAEVLASQEQMLRHQGSVREANDQGMLSVAFQKHLREVEKWFERTPGVKSIDVQYHDLIRKPQRVAQQLAVFLGIQLDANVITEQVDPKLYRQRSTAAA